MKNHLKFENFKQQIKYDHALFPYSITQIQIINGQPDTLFNYHADTEIIFVHSGSANFHIDYTRFSSEAGDIILLRPNAMHSIHPQKNQKQLSTTLLFHLDMLGQSSISAPSVSYLQPLQNNILKFIPVIKKNNEGYEEIKRCLFELFDIHYKKETFFELMINAKLNELLFLLFKFNYVVKKNTNDLYKKNEKIREIVDYIHTNYNKNITVDKLAQIMGYSKTHFMTVFKQQTGSSCIDFLIQTRLRMAKDLLSNSNLTIVEIANEVGFTNLSNFNRQFKKYFNTTPSQYRKLLLKDKQIMKIK